MTTTVTSISELVSSVHTKEVLSFSLNAQYLEHNFNILKQCLLKIQTMDSSLSQFSQYDQRLANLEKGLAERQADHKENHRRIEALSENVGEEFMKKMYSIEEKTKNMYSFDDVVRKLQSLNIFITHQSYKQSQEKINAQIANVRKIQSQFQRYVPHSVFNQFKEAQTALAVTHQKEVQGLKGLITRIDGQIASLRDKIGAAEGLIQVNTSMLQQINFPELLQKNRKFKEENEQKIHDLIIKLKKKVGSNELVALQQTIIEKLDKFLSENEKGKAEKNETKDALIFLEKRLCQIEEYISDKATEEEKDGLFTTKKIHCASCTKDMGKFQGKLGQYRPWSIFPCKQLDPEKTGGFGYMSYLDKVQGPNKKGSVCDDQAFQRMNKTAMPERQHSSPKRGSSTARASNIISNYGSEQRGGGASLKDVYFRDLKTEKGERGGGKFFRVKKQSVKGVSQFDRTNIS